MTSITCFDGTQIELTTPVNTSVQQLYVLCSESLSIPSSEFFLLANTSVGSNETPTKSKQPTSSPQSFSYYHALTRSAFCEEYSTSVLPEFLVPSNNPIPSAVTFYLIPTVLKVTPPGPLPYAYLPSPTKQDLPSIPSFANSPVAQTLTHLLESVLPALSFSSQLLTWYRSLSLLPTQTSSRLRRTSSTIVSLLKVLRTDGGAVLSFISDMRPRLRTLKDEISTCRLNAVEEFSILSELRVPIQLVDKYGNKNLSEIVFDPEQIYQQSSELFSKGLAVVELVNEKLRDVTKRLKHFISHFESWLSSMATPDELDNLPPIISGESWNSLHWVGHCFNQLNDSSFASFGSLKKLIEDGVGMLKTEPSWVDAGVVLDKLKGKEVSSLVIDLFEGLYDRTLIVCQGVSACNSFDKIHLGAFESPPLQVALVFEELLPKLRSQELSLSQFLTELQSYDVIHDVMRFVVDGLESLIDDSLMRGVVNWHGLQKASFKVVKILEDLQESKHRLLAVLNLRSVLTSEADEVERRKKVDQLMKEKEVRVKEELEQKLQEEEILRRRFDAKQEMKLNGLNI
ncbi:hypothetical protein GEMRC1_003520 [Eukaryota sp. GEM-RC1]